MDAFNEKQVLALSIIGWLVLSLLYVNVRTKKHDVRPGGLSLTWLNTIGTVGLAMALVLLTVSYN